MREDEIPPGFEKWKTVTDEVFEDFAALTAALAVGNIRLDPWTKFALGAYKYRRKSVLEDHKIEEFELVKGKFKHLLPAGRKYEELCFYARTRGWRLCPFETVVQIRLGYLYQPRGERLIVVQEPVWSNKDKGIISIERDSEDLFLCGYTGPNAVTIGPDDEIVFVFPSSGVSETRKPRPSLKFELEEEFHSLV